MSWSWERQLGFDPILSAFFWIMGSTLRTFPSVTNDSVLTSTRGRGSFFSIPNSHVQHSQHRGGTVLLPFREFPSDWRCQQKRGLRVGGGMCDGKTWSISRWGCAPLPGPGPDLKTSGFLIFLIFLIIDLYQVQIWRPPFFYFFWFFLIFLIFLIQSIQKIKKIKGSVFLIFLIFLIQTIKKNKKVKKRSPVFF